MITIILGSIILLIYLAGMVIMGLVSLFIIILGGRTPTFKQFLFVCYITFLWFIAVPAYLLKVAWEMFFKH